MTTALDAAHVAPTTAAPVPSDATGLPPIAPNTAAHGGLLLWQGRGSKELQSRAPLTVRGFAHARSQVSRFRFRREQGRSLPR
jgi:hypothetical protein